VLLYINGTTDAEKAANTVDKNITANSGILAIRGIFKPTSTEFQNIKLDYNGITAVVTAENTIIDLSDIITADLIANTLELTNLATLFSLDINEIGIGTQILINSDTVNKAFTDSGLNDLVFPAGKTIKIERVADKPGEKAVLDFDYTVKNLTEALAGVQGFNIDWNEDLPSPIS
jgi:hypothetical protein